MHSLVGLAMLACVARVHGQAIGAAVDLRRTDFYELAQFRIKPGSIDIRLQGSHGLKRGRTHFGDVNSLLHEDLVMADVAPASKIARKNAVSLTAS
jgi:hypothetical protein